MVITSVCAHKNVGPSCSEEAISLRKTNADKKKEVIASSCKHCGNISQELENVAKVPNSLVNNDTFGNYTQKSGH